MGTLLLPISSLRVRKNHENDFVGYRIARDLEDQWELMRPGKTRYENWTNEQLQERFGNVEEKMEAMSLENIIQTYQQKVEEECHGENPFLLDEAVVESVKKEVKKEKEEERKAEEEKAEEEEVDTEEEFETKEYYMTREDLEKAMNDDGTITINGQRLKIEEITDVKTDEIQDQEVPFLEVKQKQGDQKGKNLSR